MSKQHEDAMKIKGWAGCKQKVKKIVTFIKHRISSNKRYVDPVYGSPCGSSYGPNGFAGRIIFNAMKAGKKRSSDGDGSDHGTKSKGNEGDKKEGGRIKMEGRRGSASRAR